MFVILARQAPVAVILRRASGWTQMIRWDTAHDVFEPGQWLHGTVYARRCDLSPRGDKLVYFVAKHQLHSRADPSYTNAWTAVSRPPYFTALALWPNAGTVYYGGGLFVDQNHVQVNQVQFAGEVARPRAHPCHTPPAKARVELASVPWGEGLWARRLRRDGWSLVGKATLDPYGELQAGKFFRAPKRQPFGVLLEFGDKPSPTFVLTSPGGVPLTRNWLRGATWADFDRRGRLLFARAGQLFVVPPEAVEGSAAPAAIADFRAQRPQRIAAPPRATRW